MKMRQVSYKPINAEYLAAIKEVVRISDRKHNAWDKVKEFIAKAERLQPQQVKNDCKFSSPTGSPIASRETDTCIMVRDADNEPMRPLDAPVDDSGLLPCPFCGEANTEVPKNGEAWIHAFEQVDYMDDSGIKKPNGYYAVACCGGCGVQQCPVAYPSKEEAIKAWNTRAQPQAVAGGDEPLFGYEICGKDFFAGTMKNNGGKVDDIWWMTDITDYSDEALQRQIKRVEFINRAMNNSVLIPQPEAAKVALDDVSGNMLDNLIDELMNGQYGVPVTSEDADHFCRLVSHAINELYAIRSTMKSALQTPASDGVLDDIVKALNEYYTMYGDRHLTSDVSELLEKMGDKK